MNLKATLTRKSFKEILSNPAGLISKHYSYSLFNSQYNSSNYNNTFINNNNTFFNLTKAFSIFTAKRNMATPSPAISTIDSRFLADTDLPICKLDVIKHFNSLSDKEKNYAHHLCRAAWSGARIILNQTSNDCEQIFDFLLNLFKDPNHATKVRDLEKWKLESGVSEEDFKFFQEYTAQILGNLGNYKSFGDTKFIPRISKDSFHSIVKATKNAASIETFSKISEKIYSTTPASSLLLGFPLEGHVSGYYSDNISKADVEKVQGILEKNGISALNTRLFKNSKDGSYNVIIASAKKEPSKTFQVDNTTVIITYGDFENQMKSAAQNINEAVKYAANENESNMCLEYEKSFATGSIDSHRESQKWWIKDVGPVVECNLGFIETYQDPAGVRAAWEGFVATVNKEMTKKFEALVNAAPEFIPKLPWPKDFEKDTFNRPDFTSLEVINFACSGLPAGINIPNYDDIRQTLGFKNVSLGNVLSAVAPNEKITFLNEADRILFEKLRGKAFEVQVGIHELLGHGTGKLLQEDPAGQYNFDIKSPPISPLTGKPVDSWYKPGETWGSKFKSIAASYEECRAESVAIFLSVEPSVLKFFGYEGQEASDVLYICWLSMAKAGVSALEFYDPVSRKWGQAHMQARFAIMRVMLSSGILNINPSSSDLTISLSRDEIISKGLPAISDFLTSLQIYKATGDVVGGNALYDKWTSVNPKEWSDIRRIVLEKKTPRKIFVQGNTFMDEKGEVTFKEYDATLTGIVESYLERDLMK